MACAFLNFLFLMPVSLPDTRLTARTRSLSFNHQAFDGASARTKKMTNDQTQVAPPSYSSQLTHWQAQGGLTMKKISSHLSGLRSVGSLDTPMEMYEPMIPPSPSEEYQMHCRNGISRLVYQKPVSRSAYNPSRRTTSQLTCHQYLAWCDCSFKESHDEPHCHRAGIGPTLR